MVKRAIKAKIKFDYLLVDSWFTNFALIDFVCKCHKSSIYLVWPRWETQNIIQKDGAKLVQT